MCIFFFFKHSYYLWQSLRCFITVWLLLTFITLSSSLLVIFSFFSLSVMNNNIGFHFPLWVPPLQMYSFVSEIYYALATSFYLGSAAAIFETLWGICCRTCFQITIGKVQILYVCICIYIQNISSWQIFWQSQNC